MYNINPFFRRSPLRTVSAGSAENKYKGVMQAESSAVYIRDTDAVTWVKLWSTSILKKMSQSIPQTKMVNDKCRPPLAAVGMNNRTSVNTSMDFKLMSLFFLVSLFFHPSMPSCSLYLF